MNSPISWLCKLFYPGIPPRRAALRAALLTLLVAACAWRIWLVFTYNPMQSLWSDPLRHWTYGTRPLDTQPFAAIDPIGYHIYLGVLAKVTAGSPFLIAYWTALLSLAAPWTWYRFFRELLPGRDWPLLGWVLLAAVPSWSAIYSYFMQETLMLPLLGAALWATWRCRRKGDVASFALAVAAWTAAGLTRGICIPLAAVSMAWLWIFQGDKASKAVFALVLLLAVLGPLAGRSWSVMRLISPAGVPALNQLYSRAGTQSFSVDFTRKAGKEHFYYEFASPAVLRPPFEPFSDWQSYRSGNVHFTIDLDAGARDWTAAAASLQPWDFDRAVWLTGDNLINLFFSTSWPDTNPDRFVGRANFWLRWIWVPLSIACLIWTLASWSRRRERLLPALLLVWCLVQGVFPLAVNEGRYRKPFEGLLVAQCLLLAAGGRRSSGGAAVPVSEPR